ncbi:alpha-galactosidase [Pseudoruegeria sp. SK021]|nr:alpha-galactosidase [Pseudoruegeria sp. SK021]
MQPDLAVWRLDDARQTLALAARAGRLPCVIYWGPPLPQSDDLRALAHAQHLDVTGGMLDDTPDLSLCPEVSSGFPGQPGLRLRDAAGQPLRSRFAICDAAASATHITITANDPDLGLTYLAEVTLDPDTHVLRLQSTLTAERPVHVSWLAAPVLPASQYASEMIDFAGRWCGEFRPVTTPWSAGIRSRDNRTGRTGHEHFPGLIVPDTGTTNTAGAAAAFHYGWSGGHAMIAEELPDGRRQLQFGHATDTYPGPATLFQSAPLYAVRSDTGLNGCATAFQRHLRDRILATDPAQPRPVHYNCWEAVYFDHDLSTLTDIATRAHALGAERFVLDDGWFGLRDDDTTSLGDWAIDARKYPDGLTPLIAHVHSLGMNFGLWFEPEMINADSDLARAHPDWVLGPADQLRGRQQLVLNMALPQVRAYLFDRISAILGDNAIDYVKWDHNRVLPFPDATQTYGTYALLDALRAAHPTVELETCASGGGRIDFGILERTQRVWLSDSNDALERLRIQHDAALFLPASVTGSHVGPRHCHTSGRVLSMSLRAWVAAQRQMGFEMDPRELTEDEAATLLQVTTWWKANRHWRMQADILRLDSADPAILAEQQLARDGARFVVFAGHSATSDQIAPRPLRLTGLDPTARYRVTLVNRADLVGLSRGQTALKDGPLEASGQWLMQAGLLLPWSFPGTIWVLDGERL